MRPHNRLQKYENEGKERLTNLTIFVKPYQFFVNDFAFMLKEPISVGIGDSTEQFTEHGFGHLQGERFTIGGKEGQLLFGSVDIEHGGEINNVLSSQPLEGVRMADGKPLKTLLDARKAKGHHEVGASDVVHMGIVVIGHEVERLVEVDDEQFIMQTQA
jgi:hypothetical protein